MRFSSPDALGVWAQANSALRCAFHPDGTLAEVEFANVPGPGDATEGLDDVSPARKRLNRALSVMQGLSPAVDDDEA